MSNESETGWSKTQPEQQGWFWVRSGPLGLPVAVEFFPALMDRRQPMVRYPGKNGFMVAIAEQSNPEWLGPITPDDFQQLVKLRAGVSRVLETLPPIADLAFQLHAYTSQEALNSTVAALRHALGTQEEREGKPPYDEKSTDEERIAVIGKGNRLEPTPASLRAAAEEILDYLNFDTSLSVVQQDADQLAIILSERLSGTRQREDSNHVE